MEINSKLLDAEIETIRHAERLQKYWRYGRWLQLLIGLALAIFPFYFNHLSASEKEAFSGLPYFVLGPLGVGLFVEALYDWRAKERALLLKLYSISNNRSSDV